MGRPGAFLDTPRRNPLQQRVTERLRHFGEIYLDWPEEEQRAQAARCMDCGLPFCHGFGCPLGNVIPEFNDLLYRGRWKEACDLLHLTNNFPEVTGRVCPALCEASCTLGLDGEPVTVRRNELAIAEKGWAEGWIEPRPPEAESGFSVAVVGSGPAGLAAAQQLRRAGHAVTVFEKAERPGGLLRFGLPDFKLDKSVLDRRLDQLLAEGVVFETGVRVGEDISAGYVSRRFDSVCLCVGAGVPRDLPIPGRELAGLHFALEYLAQQNRRVAGLPLAEPEINAAGRRVVILGGGDTGADCLGTALRQGARSVHQFEILPKPPLRRDPAAQPWPLWPNILRSSPAHEEGGERRWGVATTQFVGRDGKVAGLRGHEVRWTKDKDGNPVMEKVAGSDFAMEADLVLLCLGFTQPEHGGLLDSLGVEYDGRGNVKTDEDMRTGAPKVFAAGDATTGSGLVVRAIMAGRRLARRVDLFLTGRSLLPDVIPPES
ncbi:MAG: glutamate synthase subunit beta [Thermodesulfobacteriota bacterium]